MDRGEQIQELIKLLDGHSNYLGNANFRAYLDKIINTEKKILLEELREDFAADKNFRFSNLWAKYSIKLKNCRRRSFD